MSAKYDVFISFCSDDKDEAEFVRAILERNGISCCPENIHSDHPKRYISRVSDSIRSSEVFVLILSKNAQHSRFVPAELETAYKNEKKIIPFDIENCGLIDQFDFLLSRSQRIFAFENRTIALRTLVKGIYIKLSRPVPENIVIEEKYEAMMKVSADKKEKSKKRRKNIFLSAAVLGVILLGAGIFLLIRLTAQPYVGSYFDKQTSTLYIRPETAIPDFSAEDEFQRAWAQYQYDTVNLVIESPCVSIGDYAFYGFENLEGVIFPDGLEEIGDYAFADCFNLSTFLLPDSTVSVGNSAFSRCERIETLILPESAEIIGNSAFYLCEKLSVVYIAPNVSSIGLNAFSSCPQIERFMVSEDNPNYSSVDGSLYNKNATELIRYASGNGETQVTLSDRVIQIGYAAFDSSADMEEIVLPNSVTDIGYFAFSSCTGLKKVTLPSQLSFISDSAFFNCTKLSDISIFEGVTSIGTEAFSGCKKLELLQLPDGLVSIEKNSFHGCTALSSLEIPSSVVSIDKTAFSSCPELSLICEKDSFAESFAVENNLPYTYTE